MMFGFRDRFEYQHCIECRSVQLSNRLGGAEMSRYYPSHYYSFRLIPYMDAPSRRRTLRTRAWHATRRWPRLAAKVARPLNADSRALVERYGLKRHDRILDVGCGTGTFIVALADGGIRQPCGIDPFIAGPLSYSNGATVRKCDLEEVASETFDVVFFHHSLEHVPNPRRTLEAAAAVLKPGGRCIVRIPTTSSLAFERYRENWVDLDPPRHLFVPSRDAMRQLGEQCGMPVDTIVDDSVAFQFWGSELYERDLPLTSGEQYVKPESFFEPDELSDFAAQAEAANTMRRGDQAIFSLRKKNRSSAVSGVATS